MQSDESLQHTLWIPKVAGFLKLIRCRDVQANLSLCWMHVVRYIFSCCSSEKIRLTFHVNCLLTDNSHEMSSLVFFF